MLNDRSIGHDISANTVAKTAIAMCIYGVSTLFTMLIIKLTLLAIALPMETLTLNVPPAVGLTDEQFYQLYLANHEWRLELTTEGELIIMPPTGGESGIRNADLTTDLNLWNRQTKLGKVFDSSI